MKVVNREPASLRQQINATEAKIQAVEVKIEQVEREIKDVEEEIKDVVQEINDVKIKMDAATTETRMDRLAEDKKRLLDKEKQLRDDKKQRRDKEKQLRDKEKQLCDEKKQLRDEKLLLYNMYKTVSVATPFLPVDAIRFPFFAKSIYSAVENDGWISFDQIIPFTKLNKLYIRESYRVIASSIKSGINKVIITGTPGIGKSVFLLYFLWKLVNERKRVFLIYHPYYIYYDGKGGMFQFLGDNLPRDLSFWDDTLWCLFDAKGKKEAHLSALPYDLCSFVLSASPRRELVNDFQKAPVPQVFYMPLWTEAELEKIASLYDPPQPNWRDRFTILGGIPRFVLENTIRAPKAILDGACRSCSLDECINTIGVNSTITEKSSAVHALVHVTSTSPFTESSVCYASQAALDIIVKNKGFEAERRLEELLGWYDGNPLTAALCGYIFETYTLELLENGGTFHCHQLTDGNSEVEHVESTLDIPPSMKTVVDDVSSHQTPNQLHVPKTKNYTTAIDAWIPGIGAFQITVGKEHAIRGEEAKRDIALLGDGADKLYWLLPPLYYHSFTKTTPQDIDQYAVLIPYPEQRNF